MVGRRRESVPCVRVGQFRFKMCQYDLPRRTVPVGCSAILLSASTVSSDHLLPDSGSIPSRRSIAASAARTADFFTLPTLPTTTVMACRCEWWWSRGGGDGGGCMRGIITINHLAIRHGCCHSFQHDARLFPPTVADLSRSLTLNYKAIRVEEGPFGLGPFRR